MGNRARQDRERQATRDAILAAARDLFVAEGYGQASLRKIAERIEYSPAAIYSYFQSKDDIFYALAAEGFARLDAEIRAAVGAADPLENLRAGWWAFYRFSKEQPEFFHLMFVDRGVPAITEQWQGFETLQAMLTRGASQIQSCIDGGHFPPTVAPMVALHVLWAALTGPAVLGNCSRLAPDEDPDALARDVLETAIAGLASGPTLTFVPCGAVMAPARTVDAEGAPAHEG